MKRDKNDERGRWREKNRKTGLRKEGREVGRELIWRSGANGATVWRLKRRWWKTVEEVAGIFLG